MDDFSSDAWRHTRSDSYGTRLIQSRPPISRLELDNYRAFAEPTSLQFAPITLIYGANSSGKSTIIDALLLMKSSASPPEILSEWGFTVGGKQRLLRTKSLISHAAVNNDATMTLGIAVPEFIYGGADKEIRRAHEEVIRAGQLTYYDRIEGFRTRVMPHQDDSVSCFEVYESSSARAIFRFGRRGSYNSFRYRDEEPSPWQVPKTPINELVLADVDTQSNTFRAFYKRAFAESRSLRRQYVRESKQGFPALMHAVDSKWQDADRAVPLEVARLASARIQSLRTYTSDDFYSDIIRFSSCKPMVMWGLFPARINDQDFSYYDSLFYEYEKEINPAFAAAVNMNVVVVEQAQRYRRVLQRVSHIGPLRIQLHDVIPRRGTRPTSVGIDGSATSQLLNADADLLANVNTAATIIGLGYHIEVRVLSKDLVDDAVIIRLRDETSNRPFLLDEVGVGVSQVLPILVECFNPTSATVLIEQPELHLHPRMQSRLADVFLDCTQKSKKQLIVETHSEHLLLRFQKLIRNGQMPASWLQVLVVHRGSDGSRIRELRLANNGDILDPWPIDFFDSGLEDVL